MNFKIPEKAENIVELIIKDEHSASHVGSGSIKVFSTPSMIALMENTAMNAIQKYLPEGYSTVGINVCVSHELAVKIGERVICKAKLTEINRKKLTFEVIVTYNEKIVGKGTHTRYIINVNKFLSNL